MSRSGLFNNETPVLLKKYALTIPPRTWPTNEPTLSDITLSFNGQTDMNKFSINLSNYIKFSLSNYAAEAFSSKPQDFICIYRYFKERNQQQAFMNLVMKKLEDLHDSESQKENLRKNMKAYIKSIVKTYDDAGNNSGEIKEFLNYFDILGRIDQVLEDLDHLSNLLKRSKSPEDHPLIDYDAYAVYLNQDLVTAPDKLLVCVDSLQSILTLPLDTTNFIQAYTLVLTAQNNLLISLRSLHKIPYDKFQAKIKNMDKFIDTYQAYITDKRKTNDILSTSIANIEYGESLINHYESWKKFITKNPEYEKMHYQAYYIYSDQLRPIISLLTNRISNPQFREEDKGRIIFKEVSEDYQKVIGHLEKAIEDLIHCEGINKADLKRDINTLRLLLIESKMLWLQNLELTPIVPYTQYLEKVIQLKKLVELVPMQEVCEKYFSAYNLGILKSLLNSVSDNKLASLTFHEQKYTEKFLKEEGVSQLAPASFSRPQP